MTNEIIDRNQQALKILISRNVDVHLLNICIKYDDHNPDFYNSEVYLGKELSKEEYDLLYNVIKEGYYDYINIQ